VCRIEDPGLRVRVELGGADAVSGLIGHIVSQDS
jgi:hypothetical protein